MKALKFKLSGKTAFFKKPDVNSYVYFTYGNIHKVALMGMFGAIVGYSGYNTLKLKQELEKKKRESRVILPEFYNRLKDIKISIVPQSREGIFDKKIQTFNNSVGYASQEAGGNLIVKEQWLENPKWTIYLLLDNDESNKIADYILNNKAVYIPYLGKNDHPAEILDAHIITLENCTDASSINSLFVKAMAEVVTTNELDDLFNAVLNEEEITTDFKYEEKLPIRLNENTSLYELESFVYTNMQLNIDPSMEVFEDSGKNIVFY